MKGSLQFNIKNPLMQIKFMEQRLEISFKQSLKDVTGGSVSGLIKQNLGLELSCRFIEAYNFEEHISSEDMKLLSSDVFCDLVAQESSFKSPLLPETWRIEIGLLPGVTDNIGMTATSAVKDKLNRSIKVYYSRVYSFSGNVDEVLCERNRELYDVLHGCLRVGYFGC
jgi:phosphoribosylformylglycinamidine synthase